MGHQYVPVLWNRQKKLYDRVLFIGVALLLLCFVVAQLILAPNITGPTLIIRTTAFMAFFLLQFILTIGPLVRISRKFSPLLYNRRHLGVTMFFFALIHGTFSIIQFHGFGDLNPIASVFLSNDNYAAISQFPFQVLGFTALIILFLMASTSHDFWLKNLSPKIWKSLHMGVYVVYILIVLHVTLGILQFNSKPVYWIFLLVGFSIISFLHIVAGAKGMLWLKKEKKHLADNGFYKVCQLSEISDDCAKGVFINNQNIAIFKYEGNKVSAIHNVCKHQMGPLSEGRVIDGCVVCPWHGYQYLPGNGQSPPPFDEKVHTYETKVLGTEVWVNPTANPEGTPVEPAKY